MSLLLNKYVIGGIAVVLLAMSLFGWGYYKAVQNARLQTLKDTIEAVKNRTDIDVKVRNLPEYDLCIKFGGLPDECAELRGMDPTSEGK